jgi:hypothetical protein
MTSLYSDVWIRQPSSRRTPDNPAALSIWRNVHTCRVNCKSLVLHNGRVTSTVNEHVTEDVPVVLRINKLEHIGVDDESLI